MVRGLALLADHAISKSRNLGDFWLRLNMLLACRLLPAVQA